MVPIAASSFSVESAVQFRISYFIFFFILKTIAKLGDRLQKTSRKDNFEKEYSLEAFIQAGRFSKGELNALFKTLSMIETRAKKLNIICDCDNESIWLNLSITIFVLFYNFFPLKMVLTLFNCIFGN